MGADGLSSLGWDERAARAVAEVMAPGCAAGRVVRVDLDSVVVATEVGDRRARARELPAVGDWVVAHVQEEDANVVGVAHRWSELLAETLRGAPRCSRRMLTWCSSRHRPTGCRWLAWSARGSAGVGQWRATRRAAHQVRSGPAGLAEELRSRLVGVEVVPVSTVACVGAEDVAEMLRPALTAVLLGPSGPASPRWPTCCSGVGRSPRARSVQATIEVGT